MLKDKKCNLCFHILVGNVIFLINCDVSILTLDALLNESLLFTIGFLKDSMHYLDLCPLNHKTYFTADWLDSVLHKVLANDI